MAWRYLFGIFVLVISAGFLFEEVRQSVLNVQFQSVIEMLSVCWPVFVIAIGLNQLFRRIERPWGALLLVAVSMCVFIGLLDGVNRVNPSHRGVYDWTWTVIDIVTLMLGLMMMLPRRTRKTETRTTLKPEGKSMRFMHTLKEVQLFRGVHFHNESQQFQGGKLSTFFGEYEVDLRGAALSRHGADLKLNAVFGNIILRIPEEMTVQISGTPILGNIDNSARQIVPIEAGRPVLRLKCLSVMSAIEITN